MRRAEYVVERVRLVGVVDDHAEGLSFVDLLETPGDDPYGLDPPSDGVLVDAERARSRRRTQCVLEVEASLEPEVGGEPVDVLVEHGCARKLGRESPSPFVADVHDGALGLREQPPLRVEVVLHRPVEVEVLVREVREHEHGEARSVEAALGRRVRRRLHRTRGVADVDHLSEQTLQVDRLGRVQL